IIKFLDLKKINNSFRPALQQAIAKVLDSGIYLFGEEVTGFEEEYKAYIGTKHCISLGNGLDALTLIIKAYKSLGHFQDGDQIIVPANTFFASFLAVVNNDLEPVFVDPEIPTFNMILGEIEKKITAKTKAIMLVHLYGRNAYGEEIRQLASTYDLIIIEDNAQAAGCEYQGKKTGSLGNAAAHSFYPGKNLAALGDAGAVTTNNKDLDLLIRAMANYGASRKHHYIYQGVNSRMDEIQAAILRLKLKRLDQDNCVRRKLAEIYLNRIHHPAITLPSKAEKKDPRSHIWHLFTILNPDRDLLSNKLKAEGIQTQIHYPTAPHHQPVFVKFSMLDLPNSTKIHKETLSLPLNPSLRPEEIHFIAEKINLLA
ncbi:MAG: DegT/DnrJ/EryC1/StrS family aminotransferase, partial [Cyclobacteriaceae bacterium]